MSEIGVRVDPVRVVIEEQLRRGIAPADIVNGWFSEPPLTRQHLQAHMATMAQVMFEEGQRDPEGELVIAAKLVLASVMVEPGKILCPPVMLDSLRLLYRVSGGQWAPGTICSCTDSVGSDGVCLNCDCLLHEGMAD